MKLLGYQNIKYSEQIIKNDAQAIMIYYNRFSKATSSIQQLRMKHLHQFLFLFCVCFILPTTLCVKFITQIPGLERVCFYQVLNQGQKYTIQINPKNQPKYELEVSESRGGDWANVFYKMVNVAYERVQVYKLANLATTYSFCVKNIERDLLRVSVKFQTGIELLQFQLLPDKSDTQNLEREITWIESQKKNLYQTIRQVQERKASNIDSSSLLSTKMIIFAVIGLLSIVGVNLLFYKEVKRTFKQRKLM